MRLRGIVAARLAAAGEANDAGTTLIELIVGMSIMVVFMGIFTGSMLMMSNTTNKVEAVTNTANQQSSAYFRLDREVRYASAIGSPHFDANMWHVEFMTNVVNRTSTAATTVNQCTQLAVAPPTSSATSTGVLKQRTWNVGDSAPSGWTVLASYVTNYNNTSADNPFPATASIATGGASTSMQQLTVNLVTTSRLGSDSTVSNYTFTALNSTVTTTGATAPPVCQQFAVGS